MNDKTYKVVELFDTIQGEGSRTGHRSVFVRLAGCNLWSGIAQYRDSGRGACAAWCDTNFIDGERMTAADIGLRIRQLWDHDGEAAWAVITGGEPMLQVDHNLLFVLHSLQINVAIETNGTIESELYSDIDHICVSPKKSMKVPRIVHHGTELKVVLPGTGKDIPGWSPLELDDLIRRGGFKHYYLQPQDPIEVSQVDRTLLKGDVYTTELEKKYTANLHACLDHIKHDSRWKLSLQSHKYGKMR